VKEVCEKVARECFPGPTAGFVQEGWILWLGELQLESLFSDKVDKEVISHWDDGNIGTNIANMRTVGPISEELANYLVFAGESNRRQFVTDVNQPAMAFLWESIFDKVLEPAFMQRFGDLDPLASISFEHFLKVSTLFLNYYRVIIM
jgi:hypothetical protein